MTETCSGSAKPEKAPAELGTDKAELARESSELFVKCKKGQEGKTKTQRQTSSGKEVHIVAGVMGATTQTYGCYTGNKTKSEMTQMKRVEELQNESQAECDANHCCRD